MTIREMIQWAREWNAKHQSSPKYRGAEKHRRMTREKVERLVKKEAKNASNQS